MCYEQKLDFSRRVVSVKKVEDGLKMAHINKILKNKSRVTKYSVGFRCYDY